MEFATAKQRILAFLIDSVVFVVFGILLAVIIKNSAAEQVIKDFLDALIHFRLSFATIVQTLTNLSTGPSALFFFLLLGFHLFYFTILPIFTNGRTLGKYICRILVVKLNETRISFGTMFLREILGKMILTFFSFGIFAIVSVIWMIYAKGNRTIHDRMANTLVVKNPYRMRRRG